MTNLQKAYYKSPLLGAVFLTIISLIYIIIFVLSSEDLLVNNLLALLTTMPLLFIFFTIVSYIISIPLNFYIYRAMEEQLRSVKFFINMSLLAGFIISIVLATIEYSFHHTLAKTFFIVIGMSLMTTINANYFLVLSGQIKIKEKDHANTKGNRL